MTPSARLLAVAVGLGLAVACRRPGPVVPTPAATATAAEEGRPAARDPVGVAARSFEDASRGRSLAVTIWYPAAAGTGEDTIWWDGIFPGRGAWDAPLRPSARPLPLVLLSHGSSGDGSNLAWLAEALALHGYLAAAVDHPGDRFGDASAEGRLAVWQRAQDLSLVLSRLLADPTFGTRIDRRRIGAAGHSSGGITVLELAGAHFRPASFLAYCRSRHAGPDCALVEGSNATAPPEASQRDRRIRAVLALAPVMGPGVGDASLRAITIPVAIVASRTDELVPFRANAARYAARIPHATLATIPEAGHFVYMPVCSEPGRLIAAQVCVDPTATVDRAAVHVRVSALALRFFDRTLDVRPMTAGR